VGVARLLLRTRWSWAELQETPAEGVDAVIDEIVAQLQAAGASMGGEPRVEL
jgi:hypothetical protein